VEGYVSAAVAVAGDDGVEDFSGRLAQALVTHASTSMQVNALKASISGRCGKADSNPAGATCRASRLKRPTVPTRAFVLPCVHRSASAK
jgi:hypothetical protein